MADDEAAAMNLRAYLALQGSAVDWRTDLVRLLRSEVPLDRLLRDRLAMLVDNVTNDGLRLNLAGHKGAHDRFLGVVSRHQWMEIGRWVAAYEEDKASGVSATQAAAIQFSEGIKKVEAAVTYYKKVTIWVNQALDSDAGEIMGREWLERLYHSNTVHLEMKDVNKGLLQQLGLSH